MQELFQKVVTKVQENKATLIKVGASLTGAVLGAVIAGMLTPGEEYALIDDESETQDIAE